MQFPFNWKAIQSLSTNPIAVLSSVLLGAVFGSVAPELSMRFEVVGVIYVNLLRMVVIPLMISAVVFSLQKLLRDGNTAVILRRVMFVFVGYSFTVAIIGVAATYLLHPFTDVSSDSRQLLGNIVGADVDSGNTVMDLFGTDPPMEGVSAEDLFLAVIPANIFSALVNGETLKILIFSLIFGFALGYVPGEIASSITNSAEAIYRSCQALTRLINLPVPIVLFFMTASQIGNSGLNAISAMLGFVVSFLLISALVMLMACLIVAHIVGTNYTAVKEAMREPFSLGIATNNSAACIPALVEALSEKLRFGRSQVELMIPLSVSLLRAGAIIYFVSGTLFVASLYGHELSAVEIGMIVVISILSGFASSGMSGMASITLMSSGCIYLGLPFEAAFILFVAVDPVCAMARTAVTVVSSCAVVALICPISGRQRL